MNSFANRAWKSVYTCPTCAKSKDGHAQLPLVNRKRKLQGTTATSQT